MMLCRQNMPALPPCARRVFRGHSQPEVRFSNTIAAENCRRLLMHLAGLLAVSGFALHAGNVIAQAASSADSSSNNETIQEIVVTRSTAVRGASKGSSDDNSHFAEGTHELIGGFSDDFIHT
jgi:hypothetical protein